MLRVQATMLASSDNPITNHFPDEPLSKHLYIIRYADVCYCSFTRSRWLLSYTDYVIIVFSLSLYSKRKVITYTYNLIIMYLSG